MKARILLGLALVLMAWAPASAVQRRLLIEDFTNFQCPPCEAIEDSMNAIFANFVAQGKISPIRPHVYWPAACDPMWLSDQPEVQSRITYYAVNYVPTFRYDGTLKVDPSDYPGYPQYYADVWAKIDLRYNTPAAVDISISDIYRDNTTVYCNFTATYAEAVENVGTSQQVYMAVLETNHNYVTGKEKYILRGFAEESGPNGTGINFANVGDGQSYQWTFRFDDPYVGGCPASPGSEENPDRLAVVVWVQRNAGSWTQRAVLNSAYELVVLGNTDVGTPAPGTRFELTQNEPNPFGLSTKIGYALERTGAVKLSVYDLSGRLVADLVNGSQPEGRHEAFWNGLDRQGNPVGSGIYYYRLESPAKSQTQKMTLVR